MSRGWLAVFGFTLLMVGTVSVKPAAAQYAPQGQYDNNSNAVLYGPGWQVMRAEWGAGNRWADVTYQVRMLLSGNGQVKVNNTNMGGDPAVGADKILRIHARNYQGQHRQFSLKRRLHRCEPVLQLRWRNR